MTEAKLKGEGIDTGAAAEPERSNVVDLIRSCQADSSAARWMDEHDGRVAGEITRYLISHRVDAYDGIARCRETDRILALLSETSVAAPGFWAKVAEGRRHGLRPIALTLCARTKLDDLEASVPDTFRGDFEWLKATVVVEFQRDNMKGSISILRARAGRWFGDQQAQDGHRSQSVYATGHRAAPCTYRDGGQLGRRGSRPQSRNCSLPPSVTSPVSRLRSLTSASRSVAPRGSRSPLVR
jgi:hypothetical protein